MVVITLSRYNQAPDWSASARLRRSVASYVYIIDRLSALQDCLLIFRHFVENSFHEFKITEYYRVCTVPLRRLASIAPTLISAVRSGACASESLADGIPVILSRFAAVNAWLELSGSRGGRIESMIAIKTAHPRRTDHPRGPAVSRLLLGSLATAARNCIDSHTTFNPARRLPVSFVLPWGVRL